jgi:hypothetical protein
MDARLTPRRRTLDSGRDRQTWFVGDTLARFANAPTVLDGENIRARHRAGARRCDCCGAGEYVSALATTL